VVPVVLESDGHGVVVWSSIWEDGPDLRIEFHIEPDRGGSVVTWILLGRVGSLDADDVRRRGHRLNQLINGQLRSALDH
jgi:hypothetical protein